MRACLLGAILMTLAGDASGAQPRSCPAGIATVVETSAEPVPTGPPFPAGTGNGSIAVTKGGPDKARLIFLGSVHGLSDDKNFETRIACADAGIDVTITVRQSEHYSGAVLKQSFWRPRVVLDLSSVRDPLVVTATWKLVSTDGRELNNGGIPGASSIVYPEVAKKHL